MLRPGEVSPSVLWNLLLLPAGCAEEQGIHPVPLFYP